MSTLSLNLEKWWITIKISWVKHTAYRLNFFLQIIGPALIFLFIKYNLWSSIYAGDEELVIKGLTLEKMIQYHLWAFITSLIIQGHGSWNMSEDIRMGRISTYLIYPFNFWEFHTASFLSFQFIQLLIAGLTLLILSPLSIIVWVNLPSFLIALSLTIYVSFFWYALQYLTGVMAFWLEETWILRVILSIVATFLSGALIPLELYPEWLANALYWTPFPYLVHYPVQIFLGKPLDPTNAFLIIGIWTLIFSLLSHLTWKRGIRLYTAAGM